MTRSALLVAVACQVGCNGSGGASPACSTLAGSEYIGDASSGQCSLRYGGCSDGLTYEVSCPGDGGPCTCAVDGGVTGEFDGGVCGISPGTSQQTSAVNQACGWAIR